MKVIECGHIEPIRARCQRCSALLDETFRDNCLICGEENKWLDFESDFDYDVINTTEVIKPHKKDTEWTIVDIHEKDTKYQ